MRQLNIFEIEERQRLEEKAKDYKPPKPREEDVAELEQMKPCVKCGVIPVIWHKDMRTIDGWGTYTGARCPICGWSCGGYSRHIAEHWNKCQKYREEGRL